MNRRIQMKMKMTTIGLVLLAVLCREDCRGASTPDTKAAQQILKEAGVTGGLVVHVGCGDGKLTAALHASNSFIVQGLDRDPQKVAAAKQQFIAAGWGGAVTARVLAGDRLPYAEEMVNLLVVTDGLGVPRTEMERVLVPGGVAVFLNPQSAIENRKLEKPWPADIDEWTHYNHDAGNTGVSSDMRVGPPKRIKWTAPPLRTRAHFTASFTAPLSAGGRVFAVLDDKAHQSNRYLPTEWTLVARDAFNGLLLWKHPLPHWGWAQQGPTGFNYGHDSGSRFGWTRPQTVATDGRHVYLFTGAPAVLTVVDAATGQVVKKLDEICGVGEMVHEQGVLLVAFRPPAKTGATAKTPGGGTPLGEPELAAIRIGFWETLWRQPIPGFQYETLTLRNGRAFYEATGNFVGRDVRDGRELWRTTYEKTIAKGYWRMWNPVATGDLLIVSRSHLGGPKAKGAMVALDAATGKPIWTRENAQQGQAGMFPIGDRLFCQTRALSLRDGSDAGSVSAKGLWSPEHHFRCYPWRATGRFLISNNRGCEFLPLHDGEVGGKNDYVRGTCSVGVIPANGLLYRTPSGCFCYNGVMQGGFLALAADAPTSALDVAPDAPSRLERGPAYAKNPQSQIQNPKPGDWPMYRQNVKRLGTSSVPVGAKLAVRWNIAAGASLTPPVCAAGLLLVADKETHRVLAFDADSGAPRWSFIADARIDSSPSIHNGQVLFGCADGAVYCLDARDGALAWRFRAAPEERWIGAYGQIESAWPVHGSVLIEDGVAYVIAGRNTWFDGGIHAYALNPVTGEVLHYRLLKDEALADGVVSPENPPCSPGSHMEGARSDLLVSDGQHLYLGPIMLDRQLAVVTAPYVTPEPKGVKGVKLTGAPFVDQENFEKCSEERLETIGVKLPTPILGDKETGLHLSCTTGGGFLDPNCFERQYWMYAKLWPGSNHANLGAKSGQLLCIDEARTYGVQMFSRRELLAPASDPGVSFKGQLLFADDNDNEPIILDPARGRHIAMGYTRAAPPRWHHWLKLNVRAMTAAGNCFFVAGASIDKKYENAYDPYEGRAGAMLLTFDKKTGEKLSELELGDQPVFDGMIAAAGRLYVSTVNGKILCLGESNNKTKENVK